MGRRQKQKFFESDRQLNDILTSGEVAAYLRVCTRTVTTLMESGKLPGFKVGQQWRIKREKLLAAIAEMGRTESA